MQPATPAVMDPRYQQQWMMMNQQQPPPPQQQFHQQPPQQMYTYNQQPPPAAAVSPVVPQYPVPPPAAGVGATHQPASADEIRTLWIGDLQYWMDEQYLVSCFAQSGEVFKICCRLLFCFCCFIVVFGTVYFVCLHHEWLDLFLYMNVLCVIDWLTE